MKFSFYPIFLLAVISLAGCTQLTQTTKLAQGPVLLAIEPVRAEVDVDTTETLIGISRTTYILGILRVGNKEYADYPSLSFGLVGNTREKRAAIYNAIEGRDLDVLINPKFMIQEKRAILFRKKTVQVAGYGGKFIFE
ncbi:MAG: hypothetical protein MUP94_07920 [Flavobacteriales bacterium]|jgi:hypothetical protein|nr:hypothetical protein [Bacteroidota bacterium]MDO7741589.1 hypothetical protein [Flavobacteriales bacterium]